MQEKIVRYSMKEWMENNTPSRTDWKRVLNMTDDDIDFDDFPEATDEQLATARHVKYCENEIDYDKMPLPLKHKKILESQGKENLDNQKVV